MVKETTIQAYVCEVCGKVYINKSEAENCENTHKEEDEENFAQVSASVYA